MREPPKLERKTSISIDNRVGTVEDTPRAVDLFAAILRAVEVEERKDQEANDDAAIQSAKSQG
jgi:hypothetical protein